MCRAIFTQSQYASFHANQPFSAMMYKNIAVERNSRKVAMYGSKENKNQDTMIKSIQLPHVASLQLEAHLRIKGLCFDCLTSAAAIETITGKWSASSDCFGHRSCDTQ